MAKTDFVKTNWSFSSSCTAPAQGLLGTNTGISAAPRDDVRSIHKSDKKRSIICTSYIDDISRRWGRKFDPHRPYQSFFIHTPFPSNRQPF